MTYVIPPGTPKAAKAQAFGRELGLACRARGVTLNELARSIGIGHTALDHYRTGSVLPKTATARAMAAALTWPRLATLIEQARTFVCDRPGCSRTYRNEGGGPRRYCTPTCVRLAQEQRLASTRLRQAGQTGDRRSSGAAIKRLRSAARIADERALMAEQAIAAMCRECEPDGLCRTEDCPLRSLSPLPLRVGDIGHPRTDSEVRSASWTPARRERFTAALERRWASPSERVDQATRTRSWHASLAPEAREAWIDNITAGQQRRGKGARSEAARKAQATRRAPAPS